MKGQILEKSLTNARQYGGVALQQGLLDIDAMETAVKNSQTNEQLLAELLIIKLTRQNGIVTL